MSDVKICGAKTQKGEPCRAPAMTNGRCRVHGGATPVGIASTHFRHGRYSRHMPSRMVERYEELRADSEITTNHDTLALIDIRIGEVLEGLDAGVCGELWEALGNAAAALRRIESQANAAAAAFEEEKAQELALDREKAIESILFLIDMGGSQKSAWNDLLQLFDRRRKLSTAETGRMQMLKLMVPVSEVIAMRAGIVEAIRNHVPEAKTLAALLADLDRLVPEPSPGA